LASLLMMDAPQAEQLSYSQEDVVESALLKEVNPKTNEIQLLESVEEAYKIEESTRAKNETSGQQNKGRATRGDNGVDVSSDSSQIESIGADSRVSNSTSSKTNKRAVVTASKKTTRGQAEITNLPEEKNGMKLPLVEPTSFGLETPAQATETTSSERDNSPLNSSTPASFENRGATLTNTQGQKEDSSQDSVPQEERADGQSKGNEDEGDSATLLDSTGAHPTQEEEVLLESTTKGVVKDSGEDPQSMGIEELSEEEASSLVVDSDSASSSSNWSIDVLVGPSFNSRSLAVEGNRALETHKNENDRSAVTYNVEVDVRRRFGEKWSASLGFMALKVDEKYDFSSAAVNHSALNEYDYFSIPLAVQYALYQNKDVTLFVGAGGQYNLLSKGQSSWLDPIDFSEQTHNNRGSEHPFSESTWALNAQVGLRYAWSDRIDFLLQMRGMRFMNSIYKESTTINQRPYAFQPYVGLGVKF